MPKLVPFWPKWVPFRSPFLVKGPLFFKKCRETRYLSHKFESRNAIPLRYSGSNRANERVRSPFCLKKVPFRSPFLGNMGPLWVPFLKTSCPPQFLEHCWCLVLFLYTISAQPIRDELSAKLATATDKIILETPEKRKFHQQC